MSLKKEPVECQVPPETPPRVAMTVEATTPSKIDEVLSAMRSKNVKREDHQTRTKTETSTTSTTDGQSAVKQEGVKTKTEPGPLAMGGFRGWVVVLWIVDNCCMKFQNFSTYLQSFYLSSIIFKILQVSSIQRNSSQPTIEYLVKLQYAKFIQCHFFVSCCQNDFKFSKKMPNISPHFTIRFIVVPYKIQPLIENTTSLHSKIEKWDKLKWLPWMFDRFLIL